MFFRWAVGSAVWGLRKSCLVPVRSVTLPFNLIPIGAHFSSPPEEVESVKDSVYFDDVIYFFHILASTPSGWIQEIYVYGVYTAWNKKRDGIKRLRRGARFVGGCVFCGE